MAAAFFRRRAGDAVEVRSAGTTPADEIQPTVRAAMAEAGIDLGDAVPAMLETEAVEAADVVITMGCGDACPVVPGRRYLDWPVADPEGAPIGVVRIIRDEIDAHITEPLDSLPSR
jgi:protein-tyrosine-phosphatase